jgi:uncharacterized protein (TIGR02145 family)
MKMTISLLFLFIMAFTYASSQDTLYIIRDGMIIGRYATSDIDSIIFENGGQSSGEVTDLDGNIYKTVQIGNQVWMAENLKVTLCGSGKNLPNVQDQQQWQEMESPAYCWYDNNPDNKLIYGALYNFYAVSECELCPSGWRVATPEDWEELALHIGYNQEKYGTNWVKAVASQTGWAYSEFEGTPGNDPNANNTTGLNIYPAGIRAWNFEGKEGTAIFWQNEVWEENPVYGFYIAIAYDNNNSSSYVASKWEGFSVRCIKK